MHVATVNALNWSQTTPEDSSPLRVTHVLICISNLNAGTFTASFRPLIRNLGSASSLDSTVLFFGAVLLQDSHFLQQISFLFLFSHWNKNNKNVKYPSVFYLVYILFNQNYKIIPKMA